LSFLIAYLAFTTESNGRTGIRQAVENNSGELQIELKGSLAAVRGAATNAKRSPETGDLSLQVFFLRDR
jgi:hypothetical protein